MTLARSNRITVRAAIVAVAAAALAACGGTTEVAAKKDVVPFTISTTATDTLRAAVGAAVTPVTVTVVNKAGEPLDTTLVTFTVTGGGGTIGTPTVRTNASGQATATWTLGSTVGLQTMTATAGTLAPITFRAVAAAGTAATINKALGDLQTATVNTNVAIAPSVKVLDKFGNPLAGQLVTFAIGGGSGSVTGAAVNTDATGTATVGSWKLGATAGVNTLVASVGSLTTTFTATAQFGAAATITLTPTTIGTVLSGATVQLTAQVSDAAGNVIPNATIAYTTSNAAVAAVSTGGLVSAVGPGTATITATVGTATATRALTVIGHPVGTTSTRVDLGAVIPGNVAFTNSALLVAIPGLFKANVYDGQTAALTGAITFTQPISFLLAPGQAAGPVVAISGGTTSRLWFADATSMTVTDSLDIPDAIQANPASLTPVMSLNGQRLYAMLSNASLAVIDPNAHQVIARVPLGGGVSAIRIAPGDTLLYALTSVGVIFEVDLRTNTVKRQIIASTNSTDFAIAPDGLFYLLESSSNTVRLYDINTLSTVRTVGVTQGATTIALSPDGQQIWLTHNPIGNAPPQITWYTGNKTNGFISTGQVLLTTTNPIRVYLSPTGNMAVITNFGGFFDIIR